MIANDKQLSTEAREVNTLGQRLISQYHLKELLKRKTANLKFTQQKAEKERKNTTNMNDNNNNSDGGTSKECNESSKSK